MKAFNMEFNQVFNDVINEVQDFLEERKDKSKVSYYNEDINWNKVDPTKSEGLILPDDVAIELGYPSKQSVCFLTLLGEKNENEIVDGRITLIGNDIPDLKERDNSFGQIILLKCHGFDKFNVHDRYLDLNVVKRHVNLDGYMFRARPDRGREYVRISKKAVQNGINFDIIGSEMIKKYKEVDYVDEVEIIFITDEDEDIKALKPTVKKVIKYIDTTDKTLQKMILRKYMEEVKNIN